MIPKWIQRNLFSWSHVNNVTFQSPTYILLCYIVVDGNECIEQNAYYTKQDSKDYQIKQEPADDSKSCQEKCRTTPQCEYWSYRKPNKNCHLLREGIAHDYCDPGDCFRGPKNCDKCAAEYYFSLSSDDAPSTCKGIFG